MKFLVDDSVLQIGVKVLGVEITGVDNHGNDEAYLFWRNESVNSLVEKYRDFDVKEDSILKGFYLLHDAVHVPRRKIIPASESLIKALQKHQSLHKLNKVIDIYNIISMESKLALGAHDTDKLTGNVTLRLTEGDELFQPLGQSEPQTRPAGEYAYIDDQKDIVCWLEVKQCEKDKITEDSSNIFYIIQGNAFTSDELLQQTAEKIIAVTTQFCGGHGKILEIE